MKKKCKTKNIVLNIDIKTWEKLTTKAKQLGMERQPFYELVFLSGVKEFIK